MKSTKIAQNFTRISMVQFFPKILSQNFTPKIGHFGVFYSIKNYTETAKLMAHKIKKKNFLHCQTKF